MLLLVLAIVSTFVLWLPFVQQLSFLGLHIPETNTGFVYRHFDGPLYVIAAKSWYVPALIEKLPTDIALSPQYYAAHLPFYPFTIRVLSMFGLAPLKAMILSTLLASIGLAWVFYHLLKEFKVTRYALVLTGVLLFFPRLLVVRGVGTPEPLFLLLVMGSVLLFEKKHYVWAGILGGLAAMTKSPGTLLAVAYGLVALEQWYRTKKLPWSIAWACAGVAAGFLGVCLIYLQSYGDFWAYFNSGDNIHLVHPFAAFNREARWVGTAWLEDILLYFGFYMYAVIALYESKYRSFFYFPLVFLTATLFVEHRDISRYALPILPFAVIACARAFVSKKFLIMAAILIPGIYMYAWNFMQENVMPVSNWTPFM